MQGFSETAEQNSVKERSAAQEAPAGGRTAGSKISIVAPVYNVENYIERCIESLLRQTYGNLEIILVDDGSTDRSGDICDSYARRDSRIKVIHKKNGGIVSARKAGARFATGDYVCSVDGDDWAEPDRIRHFAEQGAVTGADMIYMEGHYKDYAQGSVLIEKCITEGLYQGKQIEEQVFPMLVDTNTCFRLRVRAMQWCWGIKRELFRKIWGKIDDGISMGEDYAHILLCLLEAQSVFLMREHGYHYVIRENSATHTLDRSSLEGVKQWFRLVTEQMGAHDCGNPLDLHMVFLKMWYIMNCDYAALLEKPCGFLYPYTQIKRGGRIAVYGAGTVGAQMVKALAQTGDFEVTCWVDRYSAGQTLQGHTVEPVSGLLEAQFDHVAIAVLDRDVADEIAKSLLEYGIPEGKIATMDAGAVSGEDLPEGF